jgi:HAE1 family hydrophobic/amphiphilic exporter-1
VFSGMIASTCLAVLFVPTFFVVVQRFENWLAGRKEKPDPETVPSAGH